LEDRRRRELKRWLRRGLLACCVCAALPLVPVLWNRSVDPGVTPFMRIALDEQRAAGAPTRIDHAWVPLDRIDRTLRLAVIAAEDQKFPLHHGFDVEAIEKARAHNRRSRSVRGASTISQQVAKNLYLWPGRSYLRKGLEAYLTVLIEATWSKRRILEVYLNVAQFGTSTFGAEAAARDFFGVHASRLSREQAALIAGVLPNPRRLDAGHPSRYLLRRQRFILEQMDQLGPEHLGDLAD